MMSCREGPPKWGVAPSCGHRGPSLRAGDIDAFGRGDFDVWISPVRPAEVPAFPVRVDRAHEVEVRRHRLLRQPHGYERLLVTQVVLRADDLPVAKRHH